MKRVTTQNIDNCDKSGIFDNKSIRQQPRRQTGDEINQEGGG